MTTKRIVCWIALLGTISSLTQAAPLGTAFTYQGRLNDGGAPANGIYDLRFAIYDSASGGTEVSRVLTNAATSVTNGLFAAVVDFGAPVFDGSARWLEVAVRPSGGGAFIALNPRQPLTPAPYALYAPNAGAASSAVVAGSADSVSAANVTGTLSLAQLPGALLTNNQSGVTLSGTFSGNGSALTGLNAANVASGTLADARLSGNVALLNASQTVAGTLRFDPPAGPPFQVGNTNLVPGLNAALLGGLPGTAFVRNDLARSNVQTMLGTLAVGDAGPHPGFGGPSGWQGVAADVLSSAHYYGPNAIDTIYLGQSNPVVVGGSLSASTLTGNGSGLTNVNAASLSGVLPPAQLGGVYSSALTFNNPGNQFTGSGSGLTSLNASQLSSGTVADACLAGNVARTNQVWLLGGNSGTTPGAQFLGTTDDQPLEFKVNGQRALRLEPSPIPNVIAGSSDNVIQSGVAGATIAGGGIPAGPMGGSNYVGSSYSTIAGGYRNAVKGSTGFIGGGWGNTIESGMSSAVIGGGSANRIESAGSVIAGGGGGTILVGAHGAVIGGGLDNQILTNAYYSTIAGGAYNIIQTNAFISTIGGGDRNVVGSNAYESVIAGGFQNTIQDKAYGSIIGGGTQNVIQTNAYYSTLSGGWRNTNGAPYSVVLGGTQNAALGLSSLAAGQRAKAADNGAFVWADPQNADFASTGTNQFLIRAKGGVGVNTNNPQSALHVAGTVTASTFVGSGAGLTTLSGGVLTPGSVSSAALAPGSVTAAAIAPGAVSYLGAPDGSPTNALIVNANGSVGIGTGTNPVVAGLHIAGGATAFRPNVLFQVQNGTNGYGNIYEPRRLAIASNLVAVASPPEGAVTLIDVSNPSAPVLRAEIVDEIGAFTYLAGAAGVAFKGNLLAVAAEGDDAVTLISVTNPAAPVKLAELRDGVGGYVDLRGVRDVAFASGNILAAAAFVDGAVTLIDVSNPAAPVLRGVIKHGFNNFTNIEGAWHVAASGSLLAIAPDFHDVVTLADISNPAAPVKVAEIRDDVNGFEFLRNPKGLAFSGNLLAIGSSSEHALTLADVSNPSNPQVRAVIRDKANGAYLVGWKLIAFSGNSMAVASDGEAVNLFDVSNPAMPVVKGVFQHGLSGVVSGVGNDVVLAGTNLVGVGQHAFSIIQPAPVTVSVAARDYVGIGTATPLAPLHVVGDVIVERANKVEMRANQISLGTDAAATGYSSAAMGYGATASGSSAVALGYNTVASGYNSFAAGAWAQASGDSSVAIGASVVANGFASTAMGLDSKANHDVCFVWSDGSANDFGSSAEGQFLIRASGGVGINKNNPATALDVNGTVTAANFSGSLRLNDGDIFLRAGTDQNHGLGWFGSGKTFAGHAPDGPGLYGWSGGLLGTKTGTPKAVLTWGNSYVDIYGNLGVTNSIFADTTSANNGALQPGLTFGGSGSGEGISSKRTAGGNQFGLDLYTGYSARLSITGSGNVGIGTSSPTEMLDVEGDVRINDHELLLRGGSDRFHGLGWYGSGKLFGGQNINGPVLYGNGGGALGTISGTTNWSLRWYTTGNVDVRGTISQGSDRDAKEDFASIRPTEVLEKVTALPLSTWKYKSEDTAIRHIGPMAQDFHAAFGVGPDDKHITTIDADGVALAAIQGLNQKLEATVKAKDAEIESLKQRLDAMERLLNQAINR